MDVHVIFFDSNKQEIVRFFFGSHFMGHANAEDTFASLKKLHKDLDLVNNKCLWMVLTLIGRLLNKLKIIGKFRIQIEINQNLKVYFKDLKEKKSNPTNDDRVSSAIDKLGSPMHLATFHFSLCISNEIGPCLVLFEAERPFAVFLSES